MFGLFRSSGSRQAPLFSDDPVLEEALQEHTAKYFSSGQALSRFPPEARSAIIEDLRGRISAISASPQGKAELRTLLAEYVLLFAGLCVLALTEEEKAVMEYGRNPYITGQVHRHIRRAAELHDEMRSQLERGSSDEELIAFANTRAAVMLYYANALNMVRIRRGDARPENDWYKPFVEAMLVWEEDSMRERLGLQRVVPGELHGLPYYGFLEIVLAGEEDPMSRWTGKFPQLPLAGRRGPLQSSS